MKERLKRICAVLVSVYIIIAAIPHISVSAAPASYSKSTNSGTREEVCISLEGTSASSYYTGVYTYEVLSDKSSGDLLQSLRTLMKTTHTHTTSYADCKNYADEMDCEENSGKMVSLYSSYTTNYNASSINREHVWPKSLGNYDTSGPGADLHHIRPTEITPNSNRGNLKYGNVSGGKTSYGNASGNEAGHYSSYFEPLDYAKGDVARICLYMYVRYGGESQYTCGSITKVFQSVEVLLEWMELDPVDTWEMGRNEVVQNIQGNRNVFIDYPEYAWLLFGKEIPADMETPSGNAAEGNGGNSGNDETDTTDVNTETETETNTQTETEAAGCEHIITKLVGAVAGDCTNPGYSGDTYCATCETKLFSGVALDPTGEHVWGEWSQGIGTTVEVRECKVCDYREEREGTVTETDTVTETETETVTETETETVIVTETVTETEIETVTETEHETVIETETESETEYPEQEDPEMPETRPPVVSETESEDNRVESAPENPDDDVLVGCESSLTGGAMVIAVVAVSALLVVRKKKE